MVIKVSLPNRMAHVMQRTDHGSLPRLPLARRSTPGHGLAFGLCEKSRIALKYLGFWGSETKSCPGRAHRGRAPITAMSDFPFRTGLSGCLQTVSRRVRLARLPAPASKTAREFFTLAGVRTPVYIAQTQLKTQRQERSAPARLQRSRSAKEHSDTFAGL